MKFLDILVVSLVGGFALVLFVWLVIQAHKRQADDGCLMESAHGWVVAVM